MRLGLADGGQGRGEVDGTEIGNSFVPYANPLGGFALEVPAKWRAVELGLVSAFFGEQNLVIRAEAIASIQDLTSLSKHLRFNYGDVVWRSIHVDGRRGFQGEVAGVQQVVVLVGPGEILSASYSAPSLWSSSDEASEVIGTDLASQSLRKLTLTSRLLVR